MWNQPELPQVEEEIHLQGLTILYTIPSSLLCNRYVPHYNTEVWKRAKKTSVHFFSICGREPWAEHVGPVRRCWAPEGEGTAHPCWQLSAWSCFFCIEIRPEQSTGLQSKGPRVLTTACCMASSDTAHRGVSTSALARRKSENTAL